MMHLWEADEDGQVQWWVVAENEETAREFLKTVDIPSEETEEMIVTLVPDDKPFTLTCVDGDWEGPLPEGAVVTRGRDDWQRVQATAGAFATLHDKPVVLCGTEW